MSPAALVWLPNAIFVIMIVAIVAMTLRLAVNPPSSYAEVVIESHKVIIVGAISLSAVAVVELIPTASTVFPKYPSLIIVTVILLLLVLCFGLFLFCVVLMQANRIIAAKKIDSSAIIQVFLGVVVFAVAAIVVFEFKSIGSHVSSLQASLTQ